MKKYFAILLIISGILFAQQVDTTKTMATNETVQTTNYVGSDEVKIDNDNKDKSLGNDDRAQKQYGDNYAIAGELENLTGRGEAIIKPDIMITSFQSISEGETQEKSTEQDAKTMGTFIEFLKAQGIQAENIETTDYKIKKETTSVVAETKNKYQSLISVQLSNIRSAKLLQAMEILDTEDVIDLERIDLRSDYDKNNLVRVRSAYSFSIIGSGSDEETAQNDVKTKYSNIETNLKNIGVTGLQIMKYSTDDVSEVLKTENTEKYVTRNKIRVKMSTSADISKIFKKMYELKIENVGDMKYIITQKCRHEGEIKAYENAMNNIYKKASSMLKFGKTTLGDPKEIQDPTYIFYARIGNGLRRVDLTENNPYVNVLKTDIERAQIGNIYNINVSGYSDYESSYGVNGVKPAMPVMVKEVVKEAIEYTNEPDTKSDYEDVIPISLAQEYLITADLVCSFDIIKKIN